MIESLPVIGGVLLGALIWSLAVRPVQLREHERRRRAAGLPPRRRLPEDQR